MNIYDRKPIFGITDDGFGKLLEEFRHESLRRDPSGRCHVLSIATTIAALLPTVGPISLTAGAGFGFGTGTFLVAQGLAYATVGIGLSFAGTLASGLLATKPSFSNPFAGVKPADGQVITRQAIPDRFRSYGTVCLGGATGYQETKDGDLYWDVLQGQGEINGIVSHFLGDTEVVIDEDGEVTFGDPWAGAGKVQIFNQFGTANQIAWPQLIEAFPGIVDETYRWVGVPRTLVVYRGVSADQITTFYNGGVPPYRCVQESSLVYDPRVPEQIADGDPDRPRDNGWSFSENAGRAILDYMRHPDGFKRRSPTAAARRVVPISRFYLPEWIDYINCCDEDVPLKGGGTEKRWRLCGTYKLTSDPKAVLQGMQDACDAEIYIRGDGKIGIQGGRWTAPSCDIGSEFIRGHSLKPGSRKLSAFNRLNVKFVSPDHDFQLVDADQWRDEENIALRGEELTSSVELVWCPSHSQARRVGKIIMAKGNPTWQGTIVTTVKGLAAHEDRIVRFGVPEYFASMDFLRLRYMPAQNLQTVKFDVASLSATAYGWNAVAEEGTAPPIPVDTEQSSIVPVPTGLLVIAGSIALQGATAAAALTATWNPAPVATFAHEINWRRVGALDWQIARFHSGTTSWISGVVEDGEQYEVRLRALSPAGRPSDWTTISTVTATADATAPAQPTGFGSSKLTDDVTLTWTNPNSANLFKVDVYRNTVNVFGSASIVATLYGGIGQSKSYADNNLANGTYYWWLVALNASGIAATEVGPQTQTIP